MDSEFEPDVRTEETPEARIVIVDLKGFGFRREDLRVQINSQGNLIMSGERRGKEIEEMPKVGVRLQKIQIRQGHRFRKVIDVAENLNFEGITAKFKGEALRVYLPLVHILDQQNQAQSTHQGHGSREPHVADQSVKSNDEGSNPVEQEDSIQEPEVSRNQYKAKASAAAQESTELLEEKEPELLKEREPKLPEGLVSAAFAEPVTAHQSEATQSKSKEEKEDEDEGQTSGETSESGDPTPENNLESSVDDGKPEEKNQLVHNEDGDGI